MAEKRTPIRELFDQLDTKLTELDAAADKHEKAQAALASASSAHQAAVEAVETLQAKLNQVMSERLPTSGTARIRAAS